MTTKHIVCYSGGHSSALVAIEVTRRFGPQHVVLLNHDINPRVESPDIKRFKKEVADYLGVPITYANYKNWDTMDQFDIVVKHSAFKAGDKTEICTHRLKTEPFMKYLEAHHPDKDVVIYYGFDANERARIQRRSGILGAQGYRSDYPLALWQQRTISSTRDIGIEPPNTYMALKHANCIGCLKAGKQHWYIVYCFRPDIWEKAKAAEDHIGYTIMRETSLEELEPLFARMKSAGILTTEHEDGRTFFARVRKQFNMEADERDTRPCECVF